VRVAIFVRCAASPVLVLVLAMLVGAEVSTARVVVVDDDESVRSVTMSTPRTLFEVLAHPRLVGGVSLSSIESTS